MTEAPEVGRRTVLAAAWGLASATGKRVLTLLGLMLLARILKPHDFGILGFALVYLAFIEVVADLGTGPALVYWPDRRDDAAQVTFIVNAAAGVFWCVVTLIAAPYIAHFFHEPNGTLVLRVLSVTTILTFLGTTHDSLAQKDLRFRERSIPEVALTGVKWTVALIMAWIGFGAWSLVWGHVAGVLAWTILMWVVIPWRPTLRVPRDLFGPMLRYGRGIVAVRMLTTLMLDLDVIVVGRFLGVTALGLYQMAARIPDSSVMVLIWVAAKTLFPAFARLHAEGGDVRNAYLIATRCVSSLTIPASMGLFFLARPIILVFFGPQWGSAAVILSMLAIYVGLRAVDYDIGNVMKATGRTNTLVWLTALKAVLLVPAVLIGATYSAAAVAGALAAVFGIGTLITTIVCARILDIRLRSIAAAFSRSGTAGAIMSLVLWLWLRWAASFGNVIQLAGGVAIGGAVYIIALRLLDPEIFDWLKKMVFSRKTASADDLLRGTA